MSFISRVDSLGRISGKEINVELHSRNLFYDRKTFFFCHTGIDGRLIYDDISFSDDFSYRRAGVNQRFQVRTVVYIDRSRDGDDIKVIVAEVFGVRRTSETVLQGCLQQFVGHFERIVVSRHDFFDPHGVYIETDGRILGREKACQRQPDISHSDDADFC